MKGIDIFIHDTLANHYYIKYLMGVKEDDLAPVMPRNSINKVKTPSITYYQLPSQLNTGIPGYEICDYRIDLWAKAKTPLVQMADIVEEEFLRYPFTNDYVKIHRVSIDSTNEGYEEDTGVYRKTINLTVQARSL